MADCYFHGYSGSPGPCRECEEEDNKNLERNSITVDIDVQKARIEMSQRDFKINEKKQRKNNTKK